MNERNEVCQSLRGSRQKEQTLLRAQRVVGGKYRAHTRHALRAEKVAKAYARARS